MTDQQFYQENLIKILESIKEEISDKESKDIVDKYLDKAKAINEYVKEPLIYKHYFTVKRDAL